MQSRFSFTSSTKSKPSNARTWTNHNILPHPNHGNETHSPPTMFATQSPSTPFRQTSHYTPTRPSPLGLRNSNIATPPWTMGSPTRAGHQKPSAHHQNQNQNQNLFSPVAFPTFSPQNDTQSQAQSQVRAPVSAPPSFPTFNFSPSTTMSPTSPSPSARATKFADRYAAQVANPMKSSASLARSKTRKMFMNRVRNEREEGRFEARGEQMMHADYLADKRRWEESMARDIVTMQGEGELEEEDNNNDDMLPEDVRAFDEFISQEEAIEMAMKETENQHGSFSDDEYDDIFMTLPEPALSYESQDMDMS
ncbi:hypothetical protein N7490_004786 [Penicillium lividum]|nr:hypothetical protein N7490_004786 [Penicillium lividum]